MARGKIITCGICRSFADEDWAVFFAFAAYDEFTSIKIDRVAVETDKFGNAKASREEELNDSAISKAGFGICWNGGEDVFDFIKM